jgi:excisionase family DNA binding protein
MSTQPGPANPAISFSTAPEPYVDVKRAASYLSVAVKTLNEWARLEKIPAYPWGDGSRKTWRFKLSELDEWMMQGRINSVRRPPLSERTVRREKKALVQDFQV